MIVLKLESSMKIVFVRGRVYNYNIGEGQYMQNKYSADITDFFKFLLLRNIEKETGLRIGINWCVPTEKVVDTESD